MTWNSATLSEGIIVKGDKDEKYSESVCTDVTDQVLFFLGMERSQTQASHYNLQLL